MSKFWEMITSDRTKKLRKKLYSTMLLDKKTRLLYNEFFESLENDLQNKVVTIAQCNSLNKPDTSVEFPEYDIVSER